VHPGEPALQLFDDRQLLVGEFEFVEEFVCPTHALMVGDLKDV
jgi:hypothetical protein